MAVDTVDTTELRRLHAEATAVGASIRPTGLATMKLLLALPAFLSKVERCWELYESATDCANRQTTALLAAHARVAELKAALQPFAEAKHEHEESIVWQIPGADAFEQATRVLEESSD